MPRGNRHVIRRYRRGQFGTEGSGGNQDGPPATGVITRNGSDRNHRVSVQAGTQRHSFKELRRYTPAQGRGQVAHGIVHDILKQYRRPARSVHGKPR